MNDVLWRPSTTQIEASRMDAFRRRVNLRYNLQLNDYQALHGWSIEQRPPSGKPLPIISTFIGIRRPARCSAKGRKCPMHSGSPMPP